MTTVFKYVLELARRRRSRLADALGPEGGLTLKLPEPIPSRISTLPRDQRGFPIPWFVAFIDGVADFRVVDVEKTKRAIAESRCFICGEALGRFGAFIVGPMCVVNRVSAEPPSHRECAVWSVRACPWLLNPSAPRRETNVPEGVAEAGPDGSMIRRNPGVQMVWIMRAFKVLTFDDGGLLFDIGEPVEVLWFREGRSATRDEVDEALRSGLPILHAKCDDEACAPCDRAEPIEADGIHHATAGRAICRRGMAHAALRAKAARVGPLLPPAAPHPALLAAAVEDREKHPERYYKLNKPKESAR